jgi:hypothetical protein|tara:strand:- start:657 stop:866 length:210 start_codon:yes stop_codon:yes gene_type:complete
MNLDLDTLAAIKHYINKQIKQIKDDIVYGIDTIDNLKYSKGKLSALETLLQDLKDLQRNEENVDDDNNT